MALSCATPGGPGGTDVVVRAKGYRVRPPAGWERLASKADVALRHATLRAGLMAHGSCEGAAPRRTPETLARHLRFGLREVDDLEQAPVTVAGASGVRSRFRARLDGVPVAVRALTLRARGCVYDLVVVAPPGALARAEPDFDRFVESFALTGETP
jgi:hypothetical protein